MLSLNARCLSQKMFFLNKARNIQPFLNNLCEPQSVVIRMPEKGQPAVPVRDYHCVQPKQNLKHHLALEPGVPAKVIKSRLNLNSILQRCSDPSKLENLRMGEAVSKSL